MLKFIRYAMATVCFALSVGCLALWGWTTTLKAQRLRAWYGTTPVTSTFHAIGGIAYLHIGKGRPLRQASASSWKVEAKTLHGLDAAFYPAYIRSYGVFHVSTRVGSRSHHFPLWYPALIFVLADVAALRLGRRFTLRSRIVAITVVVGLQGMAVGM